MGRTDINTLMHEVLTNNNNRFKQSNSGNTILPLGSFISRSCYDPWVTAQMDKRYSIPDQA